MSDVPGSGVWDRKTWQAVRNGCNVPKGAAKVSVGDALAKFHAANAKSLVDGWAAMERLIKVVNSYVAELKTKKGYMTRPSGKDPNFKELVDKIDDLKAEIRNYVSSYHYYRDNASQYKARRTVAVNGVRDAVADLAKARASGPGTLPERWRPSKWEDLDTALKEFIDAMNAMRFFSAAVTRNDTAELSRAWIEWRQKAGEKSLERVNELLSKTPNSP
jgi:uncharacterized protein YhaN